MRIPVGKPSTSGDGSGTVTPDNNGQHSVLTREYLQNDDVCSSATALHHQIGLVFLFSDCLPPPQLPLEKTAGFRYFVPGSGTLAQEWAQFFDVAPSRFIEMVPAEVKVAYEATLEASNHETARSFKEYVLGNKVLHLKSSKHPTVPQRKPSGFGDHSVLRTGGPASPPRISKPHSDIFSTTLTSSEPPLRKRKFSEESDKQHVNFLTLQLAGPPAPQPVPTVSQSVQTVSGAQQAPSAAPIPLAIAQPVPVHVAHAPPHGGNQLAFLPRAYVSNWTNPHPNAAPASMIAQGGGNRKLAWNAERRRIFTQVEGFSPAQFPPGANSPFATEMFSRTPQSIDPRLCPFPTSMEENLTYMTGAATMNREMCSRTKTRWTATQCIYYVVQAHNLQTIGAYERTRLQHQFNACANNFERRHPNHQLTSSLRNCSTESGLTGENTVLHDYYLYAMGDGVARHPNGRAAQMLTRVIRHVRQVTQDRNVRLSEAAAYAARHNITVPAPIVMTNNLAVEDQPPVGLIAAARTAYIRKFGKTA
ncbi:hypothetical protein FB567DRAFT_445930 [Paraphoma chrysanthemicola]|uniref:Uncharacterized protein n=1 Tax=Paraphoma chrysanthemicola TaxID=798071 RepID=A0A8K0R5J4_9PLEO|nr:hypothetical protein FB567DRAFT_445930 [Paraphoma chrysanthemicola]